MGSQVADIKTIKEAIIEGSRVYAKIAKMGIEIEYLDAGGGLAIDYDGSRSSTDSSRNYRLMNTPIWFFHQAIWIQGEAPAYCH